MIKVINILVGSDLSGKVDLKGLATEEYFWTKNDEKENYF